MVYSYYGIIARVIIDNAIYYILRIPDFTIYNIPDVQYTDITLAKKEAVIYLYNCIRNLSHKGNYLPTPMSPPSIHSHAKKWFDENRWDRGEYCGSILIQFRISDMNWNKESLPMHAAVNDPMTSDAWNKAITTFNDRYLQSNQN